MKRVLLNLLKLVVATALVAYVVSQLTWRDRLEEAAPPGAEVAAVHLGTLEGDWRGSDWRFTAGDGDGVWRAAQLPEGWSLRPGFPTLVAGLRPGLFALSAALWALLLVIVGWRWRILLGAAGVPTSYGRAMRLCFVGYFFNNVLPGLTGGDLVRAVLVTRGLEERRARAAMSVLVDRAVGLFGLLALGALVLALLDLGRHVPAAQLARMRWAVFGILGGGLLCAWAFLAPGPRRLLHLDALARRLPLLYRLRPLDEALVVYRGHAGSLLLALLLSVLLQAAGVVSFWAMGEALGAGLRLADDFAIYPVVQTLSAVPIAPAGWGIGETLYGKFFQGFGSTFTLGVAVSVAFRLTTQVGVGLIGGAVWVLSRERTAGPALSRNLA